MPHFIKTGFWEKSAKGLKGWLNLEQLITSIGGSATWGNITGTLSDQTDLQFALGAKQNSLGYTAENTANKASSISASASQYPTNNAVIAYAQAAINTAVALTDAASMDLTATKQTLTSAAATRTFTISYTGDDITLEVTLNATSAVYTFPATALCVSEGVASGDNTLSLSGVSGDKYIIGIKKVGNNYYVVSKNFGQ